MKKVVAGEETANSNILSRPGMMVDAPSKRYNREMFQLASPFQPAGDQPQAIAKLVDGLREGKKQQVLMGVTGSGKTFTMANVVQAVQRPTLVMSHNKTLAAQLY